MNSNFEFYLSKNTDKLIYKIYNKLKIYKNKITIIIK